MEPGDQEASEDPVSGFLLIVRTGRIFTAHASHPTMQGVTRRVPPDTRMFQHIARFCNSQWYLTVIVTAAVYRGLGSELRPEGLTLPRNLPAPGRRHSVYVVLRLRTLLCF